MSESILVGRGRQMTKISRKKWEHGLSKVPRHFKTRLSFMSEKHHVIRNFVVRELPRVGKPLSIEFISEQLNLPGNQVKVILDDLERHLTFLFRNNQGMIAWAYPVTVDKTPHYLTFSTGERLYAA